MVALTELADDIVLHIISFIDLEDIFSFLSTCSTLLALSSYKSIWINSLQYEERFRAISCPIGYDMRSADVLELRHVARATYRLKANWNKEQPVTTGPLLEYKYAEENQLDGTGGEILTVIPSTRIAVIFCSGNILCRDLRKPYQPISTNSIYIGGYYSWYTYEYRPGELYVGLITSQFDDIRLSMVRFKFTCTSCDAPELLWKMGLTVECKSLFILDNIVGFISQYNYAHLHLKLVDILDSSNSKEVILELQNGSFIVDYKSCWVQQGSLYLHLQISSSNHEIYRITFDRSWPTSNSSLDHREIAKMTLVMKDEWKGNNYKYQSVWTPWLKMSTRGLQTAQVLSSSPDRSASPRITRLSYWPLKYNNEHGIYVGNERNYREIPGEITYFDHDESGYLTFRSYSGTYAIMVIASPQRQWDDLKSDLGLYLFHFSADSLGQIPYRKLDVPERINLEEIFSISIEERSGMIYLVDVRGWLFGLQFGDESPYATRSMADSVDGLAALSIDPSSSLSITRRLGVTSGN